MTDSIVAVRVSQRPALPDQRSAPGGLEFRTLRAYIAWASLVDDEAPALRPRLRVTRAPLGAVVWLRLYDGRRLTADGCDALLDAARRVRQAGRATR